jgi:hypothetical protein
MDSKIDPKSLQWGSGPPQAPPSDPRSTQEPLSSDSGRLRVAPGASREHPEGPQERPEAPKRSPKGFQRGPKAAQIDSESLPRAEKLILWKSSFRLHKTMVFRCWDAPAWTPSRLESLLGATVERLRARKVGRGACRKACRATRGARSLEGPVGGPVGRVGIPPRSLLSLRFP